MKSIRCLKCGKANRDSDPVCAGCGEDLGHSRELRDFEEYRRRYGLFGILMAVLVFVLLWLLLRWLIGDVFPAELTRDVPPLVLVWLPPGIAIIAFLLAVPRLILWRWRIWRRYRWTWQRRKELRVEINGLPADYFGLNAPATGTAPSTPAARRRGCSQIVPAILLLLIIGLVLANRFTPWKPIDDARTFFQNNFGGIFNLMPDSAQIVNGRYECHYPEKDMGNGVVQVEQTWAFTFTAGTTAGSGSYISYLNGNQQFSGTWTQTGTTLTVHVPPIPNMSGAYDTVQTVARDGRSFTTANGDVYVKVY